jgi:hypothetical protein
VSQIVTLSEKQLVVVRSKARFRVLVAGRRFGKTHLGMAEMLQTGVFEENKMIWYVGPNDRQARSIVWDALKKMTEPFWAKRPNETKRRIDLTSGSTIVVNGAFHPDSLRGHGIDLLVIDEFASIKREAWTDVLRPALSDRKGRALLMGTPQGRNHLYDFFEYAQGDPNWEAFHFKTAEGGFVSEEELTQVARELDPETFRQEFDAEFVNARRHRTYYAFDAGVHVKELTFDPRFPLAWSLDFNVNPMSMLILQRMGDVVHVLDEIILSDGHTRAACEVFVERAEELAKQVRWYQRPLEVDVYGDSSGNQNRTSATATDWTIVRKYFEMWRGVFDVHVRSNSVNPAVRDRVNCVNSRLRNRDEDEDPPLYVDPRCKELIKDLEEVTWRVDATGAATGDINKSDRKRTHTSDALGYYVASAFPLKPVGGYKGDGRIV